MGKAGSWKTGITYILLSLLLSLLMFGAQIILGPILFENITLGEFTILVIFILECIVMFWGIRYFKQTAISWPTASLCVINLLVNGWVLFFSFLGLIHGAPEVKGIVTSMDDDAIVINVDESYRNEYTVYDPPFTSMDEIPYAIAFLSSRTIFYEQYGPWIWLKKAAGSQDLEIGQHIQVNYNSWKHLTGNSIDAGEVIILRE